MRNHESGCRKFDNNHSLVKAEWLFFCNINIYFIIHIKYLTSFACEVFFYAVFISNLNLSAIIAMNSLFVGLPLLAETV